jgi:hypothetical protein
MPRSRLRGSPSCAKSSALRVRPRDWVAVACSTEFQAVGRFVELKAPDDMTLRLGVLPQRVPGKSVQLMVRNSCGLLIAGAQGFVPVTRMPPVLSSFSPKTRPFRAGMKGWRWVSVAPGCMLSPWQEWLRRWMRRSNLGSKNARPRGPAGPRGIAVGEGTGMTRPLGS